MQSRAPEYGGSNELPPPSNPQTLAAIAGEPASSAAPSATPVAAAPPAVVVPRLPGTPELGRDGLYVFSGGGIELAVDPRSGVIARLSLEGKEALLTPEPKPKPDALSAELEGSSLVLKSALGGSSKRFRLDTARRSVEITYTVANSSAAVLRASVADFHRVPANAGLTFFPGAGKLLPGSTLKLNVWQPVVWFAHDQVWDTKAVEASVDSSEGWIASVHSGLVVVKVVSDSARPLISIAAAYDAATKQRPFIELGERGSFELLPGAAASFNLRVFLRKLPPNMAPKSGNQELVGFVRGVIQ